MIGPAELDRLRAAFASLAEDAEPRPDCPDPDRIWSAVAGERPPDEAAAIVAHAATCPVCALAWRLAVELGAGPPAAQPAAVASRRRWAPRLAAALIAASLAVFAFVAKRPPASPPTYREGEVPVLRSLVPEDRALRRTDCVLRWDGGPVAARYSIAAFTETLEPVARAQGLERSEYRLPEEALRQIPPGGRVFWRVEAVAEDGRRHASATFVARVE